MIPIIEFDHLYTEQRRTVLLTWKERLWSWPWRPWIKTREIMIHVPDPNVYRIRGLSGWTFVCHPETARTLRKDLSQVWHANGCTDHIDPYLPCPRVD